MAASKFGRDDLGVVACRHVAEGRRAVNLVVRYSDGDWAFSCGQSDHSETLDDNEDYVWVHIGHLLEKDPTVEELSGLAPGWFAERQDFPSSWRRFPDPE